MYDGIIVRFFLLSFGDVSIGASEFLPLFDCLLFCYTDPSGTEFA